MGIKELWDILLPICNQEPIYKLSGKVVAVDLACWIIAAKTAYNKSAGPGHVTPGQHLANVFHRASRLLHLNIQPIFVLDGKAPSCKSNKIAERIQKTYNPNEVLQNKRAKTERTRFTVVLNQCAEMLKLMGLCCLTANGEAEALCAYLNNQHLVDGVFTQDSDCFAYGAHVVYRNLSFTNNTCQIYDLSKISPELNFSRDKMVVLAMFRGCDYNDGGVRGFPVDKLLGYLRQQKNGTAIERVRSWRHKPEYFEAIEKKLKNPDLYPMDKNLREQCKLELEFRAKALKDPNFPDDELINEFMEEKYHFKEINRQWQQPDLVAMLKFAKEHIKWDFVTVFRKFLPLMTLWQLRNYELIKDKFNNHKLRELKGVMFPREIIKKQTLKGVSCFQIEWEDRYNYFRKHLPLHELNEAAWITTETADLFEAAHTEKVLEYQGYLEQKKLSKKRQPRQKRPQHQQLSKKHCNVPNATTISQSETESQLPTSKNINLQKIDAFFPKTKVSQLRAEATKKHDLSFDLNCSGFSDGDDANLSFIVDCIVSRPPKILESAKQLGIKCSISSTRNSPTRELDYNDLIIESNQQFMRDQNEFNVSNYETNCDRISSGDDTIQYEPDELELLKEINQINTDIPETCENNCDRRVEDRDEFNDTFDLDQPYIPLLERIKRSA